MGNGDKERGRKGEIGMRVVNKKGVREKGRNEEEKKGQLARRGRGISRGRGICEKGQKKGE